MSLTTVALLNGILGVAIVAALAYVCRIPYRVGRRRGSAILGAQLSQRHTRGDPK